MNIFVDIAFSFIRQPIKLALSDKLKQVTFVNSEELADLVIGTSEDYYTKPCVILTDDPHQFIIQENALAICPTPTNQSEMDTLVLKVQEVLH